MKDGLKTLIFGAIAISAIVFLIGYMNKCSEVDTSEQALKQMQAAYGDSMKVIKIGNQELSQKVVDLSDMTSEQDRIIRNLEFNIFSKNREIIRLETIISSGYGTIDTTIQIDSNCIGLKLAYSDTNLFRTLEIFVEVNDPPKFDTKEMFSSFGLTTYLSRNKEGIWIGHAMVDEEFQPYVKIDDMKVEIEKDEFMEFYDNVSTLKAGPDGSIYADFQNETIFSLGPRILIKETHDISVQKSLNTNGWLVDYSYLFDIIK